MLNVTLVGSAMSLTDLVAIFKSIGDSDAVRDGIQAYVEEMLIEPEKLEEEEAVAKRAFAKLLNASGGVDVARRSFDAVHAEHKNMNESTCDEDAGKLEAQVQEAQNGLTTATALMEKVSSHGRSRAERRIHGESRWFRAGGGVERGVEQSNA